MQKRGAKKTHCLARDVKGHTGNRLSNREIDSREKGFGRHRRRGGCQEEKRGAKKTYCLA